MELEKEIQQTKFKSEKHKMVLNILFTASWLGCQQQRSLKEYDISPQQYNVMRILRGQKGKSISVNGIQERMIDRNSNASRLIDKLKEKNFVERVVSEKDRRQVDIVINKKGLELLELIDTKVDESETAFSSLTTEEAKELNRILDKLRG